MIFHSRTMHSRTFTVPAIIACTLLAACTPRATTQSTDLPAPAAPVIVSSAEDAIVSAVAKADPAVVSVIISKDLPKIERVYEEVPFEGGLENFFGPFSMQIPRLQQNGTERREVGGGTAFFVTDDGLLMTNRHVVDDTDADYTVLFNDGTRLPATVVGRDAVSDIALLKVEKSGIAPLAIATTEAKLGQTAIAIGNALGEFRNTVSVGIVSGLKRSITAGGGGNTEHLDEILQTDAAINEGNSGGPLLDTNGNVIGMNTAVSAVGQNIGFALPAPELRRVLESYRKHGRIVQTYIGIRYTLVTPELKTQYGLVSDTGVFISRGDTPEDRAILPGSPAEKAGLRENDVILKVNGTPITTTTSLARLIQQRSPGDVLTLTIEREKKQMELRVTVEERK